MAVELAVSRLQIAYEEAKTKNLEYERQKIKVELQGLASTIDGVVQRLGVKAGEIADPGNSNKPACIVVQTIR